MMWGVPDVGVMWWGSVAMWEEVRGMAEDV